MRYIIYWISDSGSCLKLSRVPHELFRVAAQSLDCLKEDYVCGRLEIRNSLNQTCLAYDCVLKEYAYFNFQIEPLLDG